VSDEVKSKRGSQDEKPINLLNLFISLMTSAMTSALPDNLPEVSIRFVTDLYRWFDWWVLEYLIDNYRSELWL